MNDAALAETGLLAWLRRNARLIILSIVGWSLLAAIPTTSAYIGSGAPGLELWWALFKRIGFYYYLWGLATPFLYRLVDRLPYSGPAVVGTLGVHLAVLTVISFGFGRIVHPDNWQDWLFGSRAVGYHSMSLFTYLLVVLLSLALKFYRLSLLREREASAARIQAAQLDSKLNSARVDSLRMQMNPHFLFNALNSIGALVNSGKSDRAYGALEELGDLLRQALKLTRRDSLTLDEELDFCESYLELEKLRYDERLQVDWRIDDNARECLVPAFVMQPLIENAIKHAVASSTVAVRVEVKATCRAGRLLLGVADNGPGSKVSGNGVGLKNLAERLRLRYGDQAQLRCEPLNPGFRTTLELPA